MILLISAILLSLLLSIAAIRTSKKEMYEMWLHDMESHLGDELTLEDKTFLLPHIFNENHLNIEWAVERYKELRMQQIESKCAE